MNTALQLLILALLLLVILPLVSIGIITIVRVIYRHIRKKKTLSTPKFVGIILGTVIGLAIIPPIPYLASGYYSTDIFTSSNIAKLTYDEDYDENFVRYIELNGTKYQELVPSISSTEYYYYSDEMEFESGELVAKAMDSNQTIIEKYLIKVFKYPVNPVNIYSVLSEGFTDYILLEDEGLFYPADKIEEKVNYYADMANYTYYVEDYNTDQIFDVNLSIDAGLEMIKYTNVADNLTLDDNIDIIKAAVPEIITFEEASDYDRITINAESKDKLLLKSVGDIYEREGKIYQIIDELYNDAKGTSTLYVVELSANTSKQIIKVLEANM